MHCTKTSMHTFPISKVYDIFRLSYLRPITALGATKFVVCNGADETLLDAHY